VDLSWLDPTQTAESYNVFFGNSPESLTLVGENLPVPKFTVDTLQPMSNYYWRVQSVTNTEKVMGNVWSFETGADITPPKVVTRNLSVTLDESGTATMVADSLDDGSHDEYGIDTFMVDKDSFDCHNIGENLVTLKVKDQFGNEGQNTDIVTVIADKPNQPVITAPGGLTVCYGDRFELLTECVDLATAYTI